MLACQTANHLLLQRYLYKHKMCALWSQSCSLMIWCATPSFLRSSQAVSNHRYCLSMTADTWLLWVLQPFCTHTLPLSACFLTASSPLLPSCTLNCHTHKPPDIHTVTTLIYWHLPHCRGYASASWQCPHHHHVSFAQKAVLGWGHALLQPGQGCGTQPRRNWDKWRHSDNKFPYLAFFLSISLPCQLQPCLGAQKQLCLLSPCTKQFWQQKRLDSPPSESSESTSHVPKKRRSFRRAAAWVIAQGWFGRCWPKVCLHSNCNLCRLNLCLSTDEFSSRWSPPSHKPQHTVVHVMRWRVTSPKSKQK